jgi:cytochrome c
MDSFELNKIIGAILGTLLFVMGAGFLAEAIYAPRAAGPGYELPEPAGTEASTAGGEQEAAPIDIGTLLAAANVEQGAASVGRCKGCHNFEQGAGNKQGPELYGVVGRPIASHPGFTYSDGMKAHAEGGKTWTYEELNGFLHAPKDWVKGTKMSFAGLKDDKERANVIAYLASISPGAPAFPAPEAAPAPAEGGQAAPAEGADQAAAPADATAPAGTEATPTEGNAVETPTETQSETPVQGTSTQPSATDTTAPPADGAAAPAESASPAADTTAAPAAGEPVPEVAPAQ